MDDPAIPEATMEAVHRDLARINRVLGNVTAVVTALKTDPLPVGSVLDIGSGRGALLMEIRKAIDVRVAGVDLRVPAAPIAGISIFQADATRDPLPESDVAIANLVAHHLSETELVELIRNVGKYCRRFVILDPVRHWLPLVLYRAFIAPFVHRITAHDGALSVRRSFSPQELDSLVRKALAGTSATFQHSVTPLRSRQTIDIRFR